MTNAPKTPPETAPPRRIKLLLIGPANERLVGGAVVLFRQLCDGLKHHSELDVRVVDTHRYPRSWRAAVSSLVAFVAVLRHIWSCDVMTFHASARRAKWFGPFIWLVCKLFRKPWIFRGFGGAYDLQYERMSALGRRIFARTVLGADVVLFETQWLVDYFNGKVRNKVLRYANSRPLGAARPTKATTDATNARRFIFIGRVEPCKGVREIISAAALMDTATSIDIYGPLSGGVQQTDFDVANVRWRGVLPAEQVAQLIAQYDALLLPTYYEGEGYPGVILEAFAAGVPVIASRWRAIPEIVDESCGLLVQPQSAESLADAMRKLIDSPELLNSLRAGAWERARRFSAEVWTAEFVEIVRSLCDEP